MKLRDLFYLSNGIATSNLDIVSEQSNFYDIPFLRPSKTILNSIVGYISSQEIDKKYIFEADSLYVSTNGEGSHTYSYVYPVRFSANSDISVLMPKREMKLEEKLFYATIITANRYKFSYGRKPKGDKLLDLIIPKYQNTIDYQTEIEKLISPRPIINHSINLNLDNWKWFKITDIFFHLEKCKCSNATELLKNGNDIAYIGAKKKENGFMKNVTLIPELVTKGNCIVFIGDGQGSVGYTTYQPIDFIGSTTLTAGYSPFINHFNAMFLVTVLDMERYRYSFGRKYGRGVVEETEIKLPSKNGSPDWQFMEDYIKSLPYSKAIDNK